MAVIICDRAPQEDIPYVLVEDCRYALAIMSKNYFGAPAESMKVIGITGGTGCGKTTALRELEKLGALIIDCDALYHDILKTNAQMLGDIERSFPGTVTDTARFPKS